MRRVDECAYVLLENPTATNEEIAEILGVSVNYAKQMVFRLKIEEIIEIDKQDGKRFAIVHEDKIGKKEEEFSNQYRSEIEEITDRLIELMKLSSNLTEVTNAGNLLIKLLNRLEKMKK